VPTGTRREPLRTLDRLGERARTELELLHQGGIERESVLEVRARPIGAQRGVRELGQLVRELLRGGQRPAGRVAAVDEDVR